MGNVSNAMKKQEPESQHSLHVRVPLPSQTPAPAPDSEEPPKTRLAVLLPKNRPSQASPPRPEVAKPAERASTVAQAVGKSPAQPKQRPVVSRNAKYAEVIIAHHSQNHEITEQYRTLCARLLAGGAGKLSLMITSADAGEGKTVTCLNLAIVLAARQENRVVVVDCDFRKKQVAQMLNCRKGPGFAEVLDGTSRVSEAIQSSAYPNLSILTAGYTRGRNAGELLAQLEETLANFDALLGAEKPLIVTSYLGRNTQSVGELVKISERLAIPVVEMNQYTMNFPGDNSMHLGFDSHSLIKEADLILVIDSDVPWVPAIAKPKDSCRVFYIDSDPIKEHMPLWYIPSERFMKADSCAALMQLNKCLDTKYLEIIQDVIEERRIKVTALHEDMKSRRTGAEAEEARLSSEFVVKCIREVIDDDTVVLNETISDHAAVERHLPRNKPGTLFWSGGSSLGWHGGAAVGMKLACPEKDIIALTGDGTYIFSCPTAVYWMAKKYNAPFMTVIFNNQGWNAPKLITKNEHPDGYAAGTNAFWTSFNPPAQLDAVAAAAGDAFARTVTEPGELKAALLEGRQAVKNGKCAVINVMMDPV